MEHSPLIPIEPETPEELEERQPTAFEESTSLLLMSLDEAPSRPINQRYFNAVWDRQDPGHMTSLTNLIVRPTGARKQELYGEFYQAQFEITHRDQHGAESYDFIWAETGAQRRGKPIVPSQEAFARDYGYQRLTIANVAKTLTEQVRTLDDCAFLLRSLKGRTGISIAGGYIANMVNTFTSDFTYRNFSSLGTGDMTENVGKLFELLHEAQDFGQDVPKSTQGFLVSRLLRAVADKSLPSDPDGLSSHEALSVLEAALDQKVLTSPHAKQRVLGFAPIYSYPSAVERMHEYLEDPKRNKGPKNIVNVERAAFATNFMMVRLREESLPDAVAKQLNKVKLQAGVADVAKLNREAMNDMLTNVARALGVEEDEVDLTNSYGAASTFAYILELLHPDADEAQRTLDQKCVDIVEQALTPTIVPKIGEKALLGENVSLLDDDEREE